MNKIALFHQLTWESSTSGNEDIRDGCCSDDDDKETANAPSDRGNRERLMLAGVWRVACDAGGGVKEENSKLEERSN